MKTLTSRQFILIWLFLFVGTKLLTLQPFVHESAGKDSIWSMVLSVGLDLLILFFCVWLMIRNPHTTFFQLLKRSLGEVVSRVVLLLLFVFILLKALMLYQETYSLFLQLLYEDLPILVYVMTAFFVTGYFAIRGIRVIGRTLEILWVFILIGVVTCAITALSNLDFKYILPFFEDGFTQTLDGVKNSIFYYGNGIILLCFMGRVDFNKKFHLKLWLSTLAGTVLVLGLSLLFFVIYGPTVVYIEFTISDLPQYSYIVSDLGRLNWLSVVVCTIALFLVSCIFLYGLGLLGRWITGFRKPFFPVGASLVTIAVLALINEFSITLMEEQINNSWNFIIGGVLILYTLLCLCYLIFKRRRKWITP